MGAVKSKSEVKGEKTESLPEKGRKESDGEYCQKISKDEFDAQRLMGAGGTKENLMELLDSIINDDGSLGLEFRLEKLKKFEVEYPFIFKENKGEAALERVKLALKKKKAEEGNRVLNFFKKK